MRRRILFASLSLSLVACASVLGDFDVAPNGTSSTDGGTTDGAASTTADGGGVFAEGGTTADAGATVQPTAVAVATSLNATCATVKYASGKLVTYCWGEQGTNRPEGVGVTAADKPLNGNFYRPRLAQTSAVHPAFDTLVGGATGDWFMGHGTTAVASPGDYAWGDNTLGQCALAGGGATSQAPAASVPNPLNNGGAIVNATALFATPGTGCLSQANGNRSTLFCWGHNDQCQVTTGETATCNLNPTDKSVRTLTDETNTPVTTDNQYNVDVVVGGVGHMCAARHSVDNTGGSAFDQVACWGDNSHGQAGQNGGNSKLYYDVPSTVQAVGGKQNSFDLAAGDYHTCFLDRSQLTNNTLSCWGSNDKGQINPSSPSPTPLGVTRVNLPSDIQNGGALSNLTLGGDLSCLVYNPTGAKPSKAYCWGSGARGTTSGDNVAQVSSIERIQQLAIGKIHACAIARSNNALADEQAGVWCWGLNSQGQVDPSAPTSQEFQVPVRVLFPPEPTN